MASPFSSTIRSVEADSSTPSLIAATISLCVLFLWLMWLIFGQVTVYRTSSMIQTIDPENLVAEFPLELQANIRRGQQAQLRSNVANNEDALMKLVVVDVRAAASTLRVKLYLLPQHHPVYLPENINGSVEIEADYISPLTLIMHSTSQILASSEVPLK